MLVDVQTTAVGGSEPQLTMTPAITSATNFATHHATTATTTTTAITLTTYHLPLASLTATANSRLICRVQHYSRHHHHDHDHHNCYLTHITTAATTTAAITTIITTTATTTATEPHITTTRHKHVHTFTQSESEYSNTHRFTVAGPDFGPARNPMFRQNLNLNDTVGATDQSTFCLPGLHLNSGKSPPFRPLHVSSRVGTRRAMQCIASLTPQFSYYLCT
jgi:hypothetical protein